MNAVLRPGPAASTETIIGHSSVLMEALDLADRVARTDEPIVIVGATGTGKELVARRIHRMSGRLGQLVPVNCFSLRPDLAHGMLFGHRRGAFTGAVENARGFFRQADRGTLFLDELTSLPLDSQGAMLRAIETGEVQPLGDFQMLFADVRIVAAVQDDIQERVETGQLRADLYERLAIGMIHLPRLCDRPEDILELARWFASRRGRTVCLQAGDAMQGHQWPGNVRELRGVIERACVLADGPVLEVKHIQAAMELRTAHTAPIPSPYTVQGEDELQRTLVSACRAAGGDIRKVATQFGTTKSTIYRWLRKWGLSAAAIRRAARARP